MTGEFPLPPYEDVPDEVRHRLRDRVMGEITGTQRPRDTRHRPLAVAAGAAGLIVFGLLMSHSLRTGAGAGSSTPPGGDLPQGQSIQLHKDPVSQAVAQPYLDRCWAAIATAGKTGQYPAEATWKASFQVSEELALNSDAAGRTVTVVRADNKPLFCETTLTSVSVSDPSVRAAGAQTQVLMASQDGILAGISTTTAALMSRVTSADGWLMPPVQGRDGMWVAMPNPHGFQHSTVTFNGTQVATPAAGVFVVDKPQNADRTSAAGQRLQSCLNTVTAKYGTLLDQASWQSGAAVTSGSDHLVITTNQRAVAVCGPENSSEDGFFFAGSSALETPNVPIDLVYDDFTRGEFLGLAGSDVGSVRVSFGSTSAQATVVGGTFGAVLPGGVPEGAQVIYTVFDKQGHQIYSSTAPPGRPRG